MDNNMNDEVIEKINEADVEEIPPTPIAPSAPEPNFAEDERENSYAGDANSYAETTTSYEIDENPDEKTAKILGIISLVTGILSILCCCFTGVAFVFGAAAVVCGIISIKKSNTYKGISAAGIACGAFGLLVFVIAVILGGAADAIMKYTNFDIDEFI